MNNIEIAIARAAPSPPRTDESQSQNCASQDFQSSLAQQVQGQKDSGEGEVKTDTIPDNSQQVPLVEQIASTVIPVVMMLEVVDKESAGEDEKKGDENILQNAFSAENMILQSIAKIPNPVKDVIESDSQTTTMPEMVVGNPTGNPLVAVNSILSCSDAEHVEIQVVEKQNLIQYSSQQVESIGETDFATQTLPVSLGEENFGDLYDMSSNNNTIVFQATMNFSTLAQNLDDNQPALVVRQVAEGVKEMLTLGKASLNFQMHPENLGSVNVRIVNRSDGIQVYFSTDRANTSQLLESHLSELRDILTSAGVNIGGMSVGQQQQFNQQQAFSWLSQNGVMNFNSNMQSSVDGITRLSIREYDMTNMTALDFQA